MKQSSGRKKMILRLSLIFCGLILLNNSSRAIQTSGYIINAKSDTIHGVIQLSRFDQVTGGFILNGIEMASFHTKVTFKSNSEKRFKTYFPEMIMGFGFRYKSTNYFFRQFTVNHQSILASESQQNRFLCLIYKGSFELYRDITFGVNPYTFRDEQFLTISDNFIYSGSKGLLKVEKNSKFKSLRDLFIHAEADVRFTHTIPENLRFTDIYSLLIIYDRWLSIKRD